MSAFELSFSWRDKKAGVRGCERTSIDALHPRRHYGYFACEGGCLHSKRDAGSYALSARSRVAFMDATGWRPSKGWSRIYGSEGRPSRTFDHSKEWTAGRNLYAIDAAPYEGAFNCPHNRARGETADLWCEAHGWQYHVFPPGVGLYNAYPGSCRFVLASPPKHGIDIAPMIPRLLEAMPRWERRP